MTTTPPVAATAPSSAPAAERRPSARPKLGRIVAWAFLALVLLFTLFPFYWMLRTALATNSELFTRPGSPLPPGFSFDAFGRVLGLSKGSDYQQASGSLWPFVINSIVYAGVSTALVVFFSATAAYAFARLHWRGRNAVFSVFLAALMVPYIFTLIPNFLLMKDLNLIDSYAGLILPTAFFSAFNIFFLRQFMLGLSREIEEAAIIDGAGKVRVFFTITLPLTSGPITTLAILGFITGWNDYFWPLLVTTNDSIRPLQVALSIFKNSSPTAQPDWSGLMAASLMSALPMLVIFIVFGRRIVNSIGFTGIK